MSSSLYSWLTIFVTLIMNSQVKEFIRNNIIKSRRVMGSDKKCSFSVLDNRSTLQIVFNFPPQDANSQQTARKVFCCSSFHSFDCLTDYTLRSLRGGRGGFIIYNEH